MPDGSVAERRQYGSLLPEVLPEYEVLGELGRGAMGVVLAAKHRSLGRRVAIKELPAAFAADDEVRSRFLNEARIVAGLSHPHLVVVFDYIDREGHLAIVMEQLPGGTLWDRFTTIGVTPQAACALLLSAAAGLDHAHRNGVYHRDIKPENLLFAADGQLKVTDFGIAKVLSGARTLATADGVVLGTPAYMAPEQAEGKEIGPEADVYACGTMLYELLSHQLPFTAPTPVAMLIARVKDEAPRLAEVDPSIPSPIAKVTEIALARSPADRYLAVEDFAVALGQAAVESWGPNWLAFTGVTVAGSDTIERASRTSLRPTRRPILATDEPPGGAAPSTKIGALVPAERSTPKPTEGSTGKVASKPVLASQSVRYQPPDLSQASPAETFDVGEVTDPRQVGRSRGPRIPWAIALTFAIGFVGLTVLTPMTRQASSGENPLAINGQVVGDQPMAVDFTKPFSVSELGAGSQAQVEVSLFGLPLGITEGSIEGGEVVVHRSYLRWTTAGVVDLTVTVDEGVDARTVAVAPTHPWYLTGPTIGAGFVGLFALASIGSHLRGLRRGELRLGSFMGLAVNGSLLGLSISALMMLWQATAPTGGAVALAVGFAALASLVNGEGLRRLRRRQRERQLPILRRGTILRL
ncbi:MAG: serine/threonine protein kinase [Actinomycetia bacterium]|nr:serine/threonine protein kinase [Actinomycetes bacterium]